ncbi:hypothetical protein QF034_003962 [Streptomyces africanus]|uniref:DDE Tnp4 domain-containing protein n=1 Tax=Streptomyces africanus TaxID=231024 RepID=A0ABU0QQR2_9ACTN|nr:hypothetical protein [Streptomyces africanus]
MHEGLTVLADHAPDLSTALERAAAAGHTHLNLDGTVIRTDRVAAPGPNGADLWWSGKHKHHCGNLQVISAPDGWPIWVSPVRPGREHDTTCARTHGLVDALNRLASTLDIPTLTDLGYENAGDGFRHPVKKPKGGELDDAQQTFNSVIRASMRSPSGPTPYSRSPSRPCAASASIPAASPGSPEPPSSCSSWSTAAAPEQRSRTVTRCYREGFNVSVRVQISPAALSLLLTALAPIGGSAWGGACSAALAAGSTRVSAGRNQAAVPARRFTLVVLPASR